MTRFAKLAVVVLLLVLIVAAVALGIWYLFQPQVLINTATLSVVRVRRSEGVTESHRAVDTATISIDIVPHGGLKIIDKTAGKVYIVKRK